MLPGNVLHEVVYNDRIVNGMSRRCSEHAESRVLPTPHRQLKHVSRMLREKVIIDTRGLWR
jgi:UDP-N-acetyl-D-mannosaminuronate dehydrogenase